tara:strand:+ start:8650 stop:9045 length:396 start_codon:yes stop_codon:yes gene_type:complete
VSSNRRRKQKAQSLGLNDAELQLTELLGQVLELLRWNQVLGYSNQYLLHERLGLSPQERQDVMKAAAGAVEQDGRMQDWGKRLLEIQESLQGIHARMTGEGEAGDGPAENRSAEDRPADGLADGLSGAAGA